MSAVKSFEIRKFSKYFFKSFDGDRREVGITKLPLAAANDSWYHYPQRTDLLFTIVSLEEGTSIYVYHKGDRFESVKIDELSMANSLFIVKYPAIGFKQTNLRGRPLKRFQIEFASLDEYNECRDFLKSKGFQIRNSGEKGGNGNGVTETQLQPSTQISNPLDTSTNHASFDTSNTTVSCQNCSQHACKNGQQSQVSPKQPSFTQPNDHQSQFPTQQTSPFASQLQNSTTNIPCPVIFPNQPIAFQLYPYQIPQQYFSLTQPGHAMDSLNNFDVDAYLKSLDMEIPTENETNGDGTQKLTQNSQNKRNKKSKPGSTNLWDLNNKSSSRNRIGKLLKNKEFIEQVRKIDKVLND